MHLNSILYFFEKNIIPAVLSIGEEKLRREATTIINETALDIYQEEREDWIEYYAVLEEEDEDLDPEDKYEL